MNQAPVAESYVLLWTDDVAALADWSVNTLGLEESWRAPGESGQIEHAELIWFGSKISINIARGDITGPAGIALRVDDRSTIDALYQLATDRGATISQPLAESVVAYSFTVIDPDGNQWWINAETGFLDGLRNPSTEME